MANALNWNSEKKAAYRVIEAARSAAYTAFGLAGGEGALAEFLIGWDRGAGAPLIAAWERASDTTLAPDPSDPSSQSLNKRGVPLIAGSTHAVLGAYIMAAGDRLREKNPELSRAQAVDAFLKTPDGTCLYGIGRAIGKGSRFEAHPKQMARGFSVWANEVRAGATVQTHPVSQQFSALLKSGAE